MDTLLYFLVPLAICAHASTTVYAVRSHAYELGRRWGSSDARPRYEDDSVFAVGMFCGLIGAMLRGLILWMLVYWWTIDWAAVPLYTAIGILLGECWFGLEFTLFMLNDGSYLWGGRGRHQRQQPANDPTLVGLVAQASTSPPANSALSRAETRRANKTSVEKARENSKISVADGDDPIRNIIR